MSDEDKTEPKSEPAEVKGTLLTPDQVAEWGNEARLVEPSVTSEDGKTVKEESKADEVKDKQDEETVVTEPVVIEPEPIVTLKDPGDYSPLDLSFEVVTYDEEGKHPKITKVKSVEQWDDLINAEPNFGSAGALLKAQRQATKMESGLEKDYSDWKDAKDQYNEQVETQAKETEAITTMAAEITYLVEKGELPRVANQYVNADWSDPEVAKQTGIKEQVALLNYMRTENNRRTKAGLKPMTSIIDAFNAQQLETSRKGSQDTKDKQARDRQDAGARVAGSTPNPVSTPPKGIMVGRGGSLRDLNNSNWE